MADGHGAPKSGSIRAYFSTPCNYIAKWEEAEGKEKHLLQFIKKRGVSEKKEVER